MNWTVYLSGEIHTDWREQIKQGTDKLGLPTTMRVTRQVIILVKTRIISGVIISQPRSTVSVRKI